MSKGTGKGKQEHVHCPFCDEEIVAARLPFCQACGVTILYCPKCRKAVPRGKKVCPSCGAKIQA